MSNNKYNHLNKKTQKIMNKMDETDKKSRFKIFKDWLSKEHFVYHNKAKTCLKRLSDQYNLISPYKSDEPSDQKGLCIPGPPGCGKTAVALEFKTISEKLRNPEDERWRVAYTLLDDNITGLTGLYSSLLYGLGHPYGNHQLVRDNRVRIATLSSVLNKLLKKSDHRVFLIDEGQHAGTIYTNLQSTINQLKKTMIQASIPFFIFGTPDVIDVLGADNSGQLLDRCRVSEDTILDYWDCNKEFTGFLKGCETFFPFREPANLADNAILIFEKVKILHPTEVENKYLKKYYEKFQEEAYGKTNLRRISNFLKIVALESYKSDQNCITEKIINKVSL